MRESYLQELESHASIGNPIKHPLVELLHELPEYHGVHVFAQLVEDEPVTQSQPPADVVHITLFDQPGPLLEDTHPQTRQHQQGQSVDCLHRERFLYVIIFSYFIISL